MFMEPTSFWKNPEGVELACYEWLPQSEIKFVAYFAHGYTGSVHDLTKLIEFFNQLGGAVYMHEAFAHGKSGPYPISHPKRCQIDKLVGLFEGFHISLNIILSVFTMPQGT